MCGIVGLVRQDGAPPGAIEIRAMCSAIAHRGPDDEGVYVGDGVALGMRRLSIIGLSTGRQPIPNEDGTAWVVFNGEIYNYRELRGELEHRGHRFATTTDTEVLVHLYEEYGAAMTDRLRGMFAFAIWDARRHELLLARDRLGIKPLFYAPLASGGLAFASELKALLRLPEVPRELSWPAVSHLFTFLATPSTRSILDGVRKLDAGHQAILRRGQPLAIDRYWDLEFEPDREASEGELGERLRMVVDEAVDLHLRSDVPVGAFLSGGLDSSAVVASMSRRMSSPVRTFSVGFADARFDERTHARRVAEAFGTDHHELVLTPQGIDVIDDLFWHLDEPFGDSSAIPTYMVARLAAQHVKVVLTGDGGDELFGGYDKYVVEQRERRYDRLPPAITRLFGRIGGILPHGAPGQRWLAHFGLKGAHRYLDASTLFSPREQARLFTADVRELVRPIDPLESCLSALDGLPAAGLSALQYCDIRGYLPLDILTKVDRMTMAHSLEARPVLLDHRVVEFAATIPEQHRIRRGVTKYLFKEAMRDRLPGGIVDRAKQGFAVPLAHWFRGPWMDVVRDVLQSSASRQRGIINPAYVEHLLRLNRRGRNMDRELWTLVSFEQWCRTFLDQAPAPAASWAPPVLLREGA
jgi:asparagine synthase (glutamine-hydrolysing)